MSLIGPEVARPSLGREDAESRARIEALERTPRIHTLMVFMGGPEIDFIPTGDQVDMRMNARYQILSWTMLADQQTNAQMDILKTPYVNYPPVPADSIVGSNPPNIIADDHADEVSAVLEATWTTTRIEADDCLRFVLDSCDDALRLSLMLELIRI